MSSSAARVWMTTGLPVAAASASCASNSSCCAVGRRVVAEVVESGLADRDRARVREQLAAARRARRGRSSRPRGDGSPRTQCTSSVVSARASDRRAPARLVATSITRVDAGCPGAGEHLGRVVAEMRVGVDHGVRRSRRVGVRQLDAREERRRRGDRIAGDELPVRDLLPAELLRLAERGEDLRRGLGQIREERDRCGPQPVARGRRAPGRAGRRSPRPSRAPTACVSVTCRLRRADERPDALERAVMSNAVDVVAAPAARPRSRPRSPTSRPGRPEAGRRGT